MSKHCVQMGSGSSSSRGSDQSQAHVVVLQPTQNGATSSAVNSNHVNQEVINTALQSSKKVDNNHVGGGVARTAVLDTPVDSAHVISSSAEPQATEASGEQVFVCYTMIPARYTCLAYIQGAIETLF